VRYTAAVCSGLYTIYLLCRAASKSQYTL
jgi:hypothetical protein